MARESMNFDVVIVGAGPAGLSAAIRLKQLSKQNNQEISVCVLEKGAEVGAHILSGAVLEPRALNELIPDWADREAPIDTLVSEDRFLFLTKKTSYRLPTPPQMRNHGNYIVSLSDFCKWLGEQAEALGVEIYPGFAATEILYNTEGHVCGVATGDMGIDKNAKPTSNYQSGMELHAKQTIFSEGCRGSLTQLLIKQFNLAKHSQVQTYGLGIKELWEVEPSNYKAGLVIHSVGWPLDRKTYGGSFLYHFNENKVAVGFVVGLDYENPYLSPFEEFQRFKTHPSIAPFFAAAKRIGYGARAINEGGYQSIPKLTFPGGMLVGCAAGFLNVPKIKGSHTAMKSGMIAAEAIFDTLLHSQLEIKDYPARLKKSWVWKELKKVRNIRPGFRFGLWTGLLYAAAETYLFKGKIPWTFSHSLDNQSLKPASRFRPIEYPRPDGKLTFDRASSVYCANLRHEENQPVHLTLKNSTIPIEINYKLYASPETRYCPAGVYEIVEKEKHPQLQINAQNCVHCKTCDIKDPMQNIVWIPPEGGSGPNYSGM